MALTADRLRELLHYNPDTGEFVWLEGRSTVTAGMVAGSNDHKGYWRMQIDGRVYRAHRLAWLYMTGQWPDGLIDHRDRDRTNNRFSNLRKATPSQNAANGRARRTGLKGAHRNRGRWEAKVRKNGKAIYLGSFATEAEAHAAYLLGAREHFGEFARGE